MNVHKTRYKCHSFSTFVFQETRVRDKNGMFLYRIGFQADHSVQVALICKQNVHLLCVRTTINCAKFPNVKLFITFGNVEKSLSRLRDVIEFSILRPLDSKTLSILSC
jgi:hypothetical protein